MTYQWPKPRRLHFLVAACGSLGFSQGSGSLAFQLLGLLSLLLSLGQDLGVLSGSQPNFTKAWVSENQINFSSQNSSLTCSSHHDDA